MLSSAFFAVLRVRGFFSGFTSAAPSSFALFEAVAFLAARFLAGAFSSVAAAESVAVDAVFLVFFAFAAFFGASASSAWASTDVVFDERRVRVAFLTSGASSSVSRALVARDGDTRIPFMG